MNLLSLLVVCATAVCDESDERSRHRLEEYFVSQRPAQLVSIVVTLRARSRDGLVAVSRELTKALRSGDKHVKNLALHSAAELGRRGSVVAAEIIRLLDDEDHAVRIQAIYALGSIGDQEGIKALGRTLRAGRNDAERIAAALAMGRAGTADSVEPLLNGLKDVDPDVRAASIIAIKDLGVLAKAGVGSLQRALYDEATHSELISSDFQGRRPIRYDVIEALAKIGPDARAAVPELVKIMERDRDDVACLAAAYAICLIEPRNDRGFAHIVRSLRHPSVTIRAEAAIRSGQLGDAGRPIVPALLRAMNDPESEVRSSAAIALGSIRSNAGEVVPVLTKALTDVSTAVRAEAVSSLGEFGKLARESVTALKRTLAEEGDAIFSESVRVRTCVALARIVKQEEAATILAERALLEPSGEVRMRLLTEVMKCGTNAKGAVTILRRLLNDKDGSIRDLTEEIIAAIESEGK